MLFTQGCESETYDVLDLTPKECKIMRCKYFSSMNPTYGWRRGSTFFNKNTQFPNACLPIYTTQKQEHNYLLCLILIYKESKCKSFNASLLSIKMKELNADTKDMKKKGFQTKHALTG
jgi:hypothetical protein